MRVKKLTVAIVLLATLVASACAPADGRGNADRAASESRAPKVLRVAVQGEPVGFVDVGATRPAAATATRYAKILGHEALTAFNEQSAVIPQLATDVISVEAGTWRVNPDASMDTTWKIRPGARWHDGAPFTSADLLFSFDVFKDPAIPNWVPRTTRLG